MKNTNKGELLLAEIRKRRLIDEDTFAAGLIVHHAAETYSVRFVAYRNRGGIARMMSVRDMEKIAPDLVAQLRADTSDLKAYLKAVEAPTHPRGQGTGNETQPVCLYRQD